MILVLLGTQNNSFCRLLEKIEKLLQNKKIEEQVIVQAGYTKFQSNNMKILDFITKEELEELLEKADIVITHGGVGSILLAITKNKKAIAVPRLNKYQEHVNDHQKEIVELFHKKGYIIGLQEVEELEQAIQQIEEFKPQKYEPDNHKMLKTIEDFIEKCPTGSGFKWGNKWRNKKGHK